MNPLRVLLLEDNLDDADLILRELRKEGLDFTVQRVETESDYRRQLKEGAPDIILSDYALPTYDGLSALSVARELCPETPFLLVSGTLGEETAIDALKRGAKDYVLKQRLARLGSAVRRALEDAAEHLQRRQAEEALRVSERKFLSVFQNAAVGLVIAEGDEGRIVNVNRQFCDMLGYTTAELLQLTSRDITHAEDLSEDKVQMEGISSGSSREFTREKRYRRKDGSCMWARAFVAPLDPSESKPNLMIGVFVDVTEQVEALEKVRSQAQLLDLAQDAIMVRDLNGTIEYWNQGAEKMSGWTAAEVIGRNVSLLLNPNDSINLACLPRTISTGEWSGELVKTTKAGMKVTVLSRWTLMRDTAGCPKSVLIVETDISAHKVLEAQFLRAQRMEAIGTLAGGIAHDLNNVLAPILLMLGMIKDRLNNDQDHTLLCALQGSVQRGADLVQQVLSFARGVEGQHFVVNAAHLVRDIQKIIQETFPKNIVLLFKSNRALWSVTGDPTQLHQVIMNLCVNARDAMPDGGKLTVTIVNNVLDEVQADLIPESKPGAYVLLTVADTGCGIPLAIQNKIYEAFFTTKEEGKGTGLGLFTTATIIRSHGGFIDLHSEPGHGATFKVYLPANTASQEVDITPIEQSQLPQGNGEWVLVVDDEENIRFTVQKLLEHSGYHVLLAANGAEAAALYAQHRQEIAVVFTDMAMPVMDGPAAIAAIRILNPKVKIIGTSGLSSKDGEKKAVAAGVLHFVPKPYSAETILKILAQTLHEPAIVI